MINVTVTQLDSMTGEIAHDRTTFEEFTPEALVSWFRDMTLEHGGPEGMANIRVISTGKVQDHTLHATIEDNGPGNYCNMVVMLYAQRTRA